MEIRMYNVGFGDCFLIFDDTESLLIDFGSDTPSKYLHTVKNNIISHNVGKDLSVLLTHFHNDHINGFWETNVAKLKAIKKIYLPDIFEMNRHIGREKINFLQLHILHDIFSSITLNKRPFTITLFSLLRSLTSLRTNIHFIKRGSVFSHFSKQYQVLWPSFDDLYVHKRVEKGVIKTLIDIGFLKDNMDDFSDTVNLGVIDEFIKALLNGYDQLSEGFVTDETIARIEGLLENVTDTFDDYLRDLSSGHIADITAKAVAMKLQANRISVVFQDQAVKNASSLLMTGDIPGPDLRKIIQNKLSPCGFNMSKIFRVIKAPHHATDSHFTNLLPYCEYILASNGIPRSRHRKWGEISYLYGSFYGSHKHCTMICTNIRCELHVLRAKGINECMGCPNSNKNWTDLTL